MGLRIRNLFENAFELDKIEDKVFDEIGNIVSNWCLVKKAEQDTNYSWNHHHWLDELRNALDRCFRAIKNAKYSKKSLDRRIDDAFLTDSRSDNVDSVFGLMYGKLVEDEHIPETEALSLVEDWVQTGLGEILNVLKGDSDSRRYIALKREKAPYRKSHK